MTRTNRLLNRWKIRIENQLKRKLSGRWIIPVDIRISHEDDWIFLFSAGILNDQMFGLEEWYLNYFVRQLAATSLYPFWNKHWQHAGLYLCMETHLHIQSINLLYPNREIGEISSSDNRWKEELLSGPNELLVPFGKDWYWNLKIECNIKIELESVNSKIQENFIWRITGFHFIVCGHSCDLDLITSKVFINYKTSDKIE